MRAAPPLAPILKPFCAAVLAVGLAGAAWAQDVAVLKSVSAPAMVRILGQLGMDPGEPEKLASGNIRIPIATEAAKGSLYLYCSGKTCDGLQAASGFSMGDKPTLKTINRWNESKRYSRACLDEDLDPRLESDLDLTGGVTESAIKEFLRTYRISLKAFVKHIEFE